MLRFAPSPTGDMRTEQLRIAIFNYIVAKQKETNFIVRIEDTDKERNITGKDTEILQILEKFAITHDSVFHQSEHLNIHQTLAIRLLEEGKAFVCTCTPEALESDKTPSRYNGKCFDVDKEELKRLKSQKLPFVIRLKKPEDDIVIYDLYKGESITPADEVDSFVILRADATPTENFASACDDMLSGIDFIIRSEEHLHETPKQEYIKKQLGYKEETTYAHLPIILNEEGQKMSESDNAFTVKWLFEEGYIPDAIANYLILPGNTTPTDIFTLPEAIKWFDISKLSGSPVKFDIEELRLLNRKHLERIDDKRLSSLFGFADADIGKLAKLYMKEAATINELDARIKAIFSPKDFDGKWGEQMRILEKIIAEAPMFATFEAFESHLMKESGLSGEHFSKPLRVLLTGAEQGPELSDIYPYIKSYLLEVAS
ncbi:glutamylglutaminyl-tRNA ligase [Sulfurovum lithotrophicum]|uniref:Glutamate--tRNA ligase n=1 Tax=Sulfurovum lithotrophicum TaxID=206403 RepID=A0A7U4M120_9BACT|nr:glutamate--tRNA ligase [Sulfurovum lithotrophicum]AKF24852.1 glutamylglutaminyl-tRNA ligase [Sulfurovum lithotrophicum]